jgi:hypothetical protein
MWVRLCAVAMGLGLLCVVGGLGLAAHVQVERLGCDAADPCGDTASRQRLAIEAGLFGVILTASATAALAWKLMRIARPPIRIVRPVAAGRDGPPAREPLAPFLAPRR